MASVDCKGNETSLNECKFSGWGTSECDYGESAGLQCFDNINNDTIGTGKIYMSRVMRKPAFCICEKQRRRSASRLQLRGNREADQRLCFRYIASTIPLLSKSEISNL